MAKHNLKSITAKLEARKLGERVIIVGGVLAVIVTGWLTFAHDPMAANQANLSRRITVADSQIVQERNRQVEIEGTYTADPNAFALTRQTELREATARADARLDELYGELISPQQMSQVLTAILQRETNLKLISLENRPSEALLTTSLLSTAVAGIPAANVQVFKHGLRMVFEGNYLETVNYLRNLERLDNNFFWESLEFSLGTYPNGRITLDIYTLSTQRGWIGV